MALKPLLASLGLGAALLAPAAAEPDLSFGLAAVHSFDAVADAGRLHLLLAGPDATGEMALRYVHSDDGGRQFAAAVPVGQSQARSHRPHRGADVQLLARGDQRLAVWTVAGSGYGGSGPLATALSADAGRSFRPGPNPADDASQGGHAYVALAAAGQGFHAIWLDSRDGSQGLRHAVSVDGGASWGANRSADTQTCECCWNRLLGLPDGELLALYRDQSPRDMALLAWRDGAWERRAPPGDFGWQYEGCPHVGGALAFAGERLHALSWTGQSGQQGLWALHSDDRGRLWAAPQRLGGERARHADLAAAGDRVVAVWDEREAGESRLLLAQSLDRGASWRAPWRLARNAERPSHPRVLALGDEFVVLWTQSGADGNTGLGLWRVPAVHTEGNTP